MYSLRSAACWIARTAAAIAIALLATPAVWAAAPEPQPVGPDYVKSYMLTILVCSLGIVVVGRTAHRTTEIKFHDED